MAYLCIVFFLMFCYFAYLNLNDPDAPLWVGIYIAAALVCILAFFKIASLYFDIALIIFYMGYSIKNWPEKWEGVRMPMAHNINIERGRESLGLWICTICTAFSYLVGKGGPGF